MQPFAGLVTVLATHPGFHLFRMVKRSQIRAFTQAIARRFHRSKIVLFGSYAYGNPTDNSDVDLLVIMPRTRDRGERMSVRILHAFHVISPSTCWYGHLLTWPSGCAGKTFLSVRCWRRGRCSIKTSYNKLGGLATSLWSLLVLFSRSWSSNSISNLVFGKYSHGLA